ncbi:MAG: molybdopterin oxidoreductase [Dehalococcoidia bacterium]|nr:MAG: molybdopterin oxidoreductase [Dehalococcoidia bacterium]
MVKPSFAPRKGGDVKPQREKVRTFCRMCFGRCGLLVTVEGERVIKVEGDPESPLSKGELCPKGAALPQILYHPDRLRYPQRREGERGKGEWVSISWDEALTTIAQRLNSFKRDFGPESVVIGLGDPKGLELAFAQRFASAFGTPNVATPGHICHMPRDLASAFTFGSPCLGDNQNLPSCIVVWGSNMLQTHDASITRSVLRSALNNGAKLIVIDPQKTALASRAELWIKPRPGSDGSLALGVMKVMIEENLCDENFVANWTTGFDRLREHIKNYPLDVVEEITWVPREQIAEAARLYAQIKPATIQWGNALDHTSNSFQTCRAISILRAISGNVDIPGGDIMPSPIPITRPGHFMLLREFPRKLEKMIGGEFKLAARSAFIPRQSVIKAILEAEPYPVKAALLIGTNPLLTYPNAKETYDALMKLEFLVVSELFMTPTAELADIVLPAATNFEFDEVGPYPSLYLLAYPKIVEPPGECWSDMRMINELAKRVGLEEYFWADERDALDLILQPTGLSFEEFKKEGILQAERKYRKYEESGFRTPSGKVEIYSQQLEELGYSPLPIYNEPPETPYSSPELAREYPLVLTNAKEPCFCHSAHRNIPRLRRIAPEPRAQLNPETAARLGLKDGDWVYIETKRGRIRQRLSLNGELDPRVVVVAFGWWFPEKGASQLYGWAEANVNILTESAPPYEPALGSVNLRGILCKVSKA